MDIGFNIPSVVGQNTMGRGVKVPWIGGSICHGKAGQNIRDRGFDIPWVGGQNTMGRR